MRTARALPAIALAALASASAPFGGSGDGSVRAAPSTSPEAPSRAPVPAPRPAGAGPAIPSPPPSPVLAEPEATADPAGTCRKRLAGLGAVFTPVEAPRAEPPCHVADPVRLEALADRERRITLPDRPVLACSFALVLTAYARDVLGPLARGLAGDELASFGTGPGFACRPRNRMAGAAPSAHGRGEAVDIGWFGLAGGRRIVVGEASSPDDSLRFVGAVRRSACGWFTTVLGPGADEAHADHLHLDRERRGRSGDHRLCQ